MVHTPGTSASLPMNLFSQLTGTVAEIVNLINIQTTQYISADATKGSLWLSGQYPSVSNGLMVDKKKITEATYI